MVCGPRWPGQHFIMEILNDPTGKMWVENSLETPLFYPRLYCPPDTCIDVTSDAKPIVEVLITSTTDSDFVVLEVPLTRCKCCCPDMTITRESETVNPGGTIQFHVEPP